MQPTSYAQQLQAAATVQGPNTPVFAIVNSRLASHNLCLAQVNERLANLIGRLNGEATGGAKQGPEPVPAGALGELMQHADRADALANLIVQLVDKLDALA